MINLISLLFISSFFLNSDGVKKTISLNKEEINYFKETAFYENRLNRWERPVLIEIKGKPSKEDIKQLTNLVQEIAPYLGNTSIQIVKNNGNLVFHFESDLSQFDENPAFKNNKIPLGFMKPMLSKQHQFIKAEVFIHPAIIATKRYEVLRHELCHSLGLMSHSFKAFQSANLLGKTVYKDLKDYEKSLSEKNIPNLDKMAIKFLYQDIKSTNYSKKDFDRDYSKFEK